MLDASETTAIRMVHTRGHQASIETANDLVSFHDDMILRAAIVSVPTGVVWSQILLLRQELTSRRPKALLIDGVCNSIVYVEIGLICSYAVSYWGVYLPCSCLVVFPRVECIYCESLPFTTQL